MIITTKRPAVLLITDTLVTTAAWLGFFYQFTKGAFFMLSEAIAEPISSFATMALGSTYGVVLACLAVLAFNAILVFIWAAIQNASGNRRYRNQTQNDITVDVLADHFRVSPQQLSEVQDSRLTTVHHSAAGAITRLETDRLQLSGLRFPIFEPAVRAA